MNQSRYLVLSDIHSNLEALEKCLEISAGKYDRAVCLGDVVGYGPDPNAVIERVREKTVAVIRGNHDRACSGLDSAEDFNPIAQLAVVWTRKELTPGNVRFLRDLPAGPLPMPGFEMVHGSAEDEDEYILSGAEALPALRCQAIQLVFFGHTHLQGVFSLNRAGAFRDLPAPQAEDGLVLSLPLEQGARYLVNPGSVGQPRDQDWRAAFSIFDGEERRVEFYRTPYDLAATQKKMAAAKLPELLIRRLESGR